MRFGHPTAEALYAYEAQSDAELSLVEGETVELTATGMNAGEGWAEVSNLTRPSDAMPQRAVGPRGRGAGDVFWDQKEEELIRSGARSPRQVTKSGRTGLVPAAYVSRALAPTLQSRPPSSTCRRLRPLTLPGRTPQIHLL